MSNKLCLVAELGGTVNNFFKYFDYNNSLCQFSQCFADDSSSDSADFDINENVEQPTDEDVFMALADEANEIDDDANSSILFDETDEQSISSAGEDQQLSDDVDMDLTSSSVMV